MINYRGLSIPYTSFGAVNSDHLFGPNEQVIFDFYVANKNRYKRAIDIGANIGVHSILMAQNSWEVQAFEPDPHHFHLLCKNLNAHGAWSVAPQPFAVSTKDGETEFVRVLGNTTGSHIKGEKHPYGDLETFRVRTVDCRRLFDWADFAKIDCEGHEAEILGTTTPEQLLHLECMVEVGNEDTAGRIFDHFKTLDVPLWSQKIGWKPVEKLADMPSHHSHGSLYIGKKSPEF
jgi:FkbM family methyltransferase